MKKILLIVCLLSLPFRSFAVDISLNGVPYTLNPHPRIMVGGNVSLNELQSRMTESNRFWMQMKDTILAWRVAHPDHSGISPDGGSHEYMKTYALMYMLDPVTYPDLGAAAKEMLMEYPNYTISNYATTDTIRAHLASMAKTYDWIYPLLSTADKNALHLWVNDTVYPHTLTGSSINSPWHNLYVTQFQTFLLWGLATYEDNQIADGIGSSGYNSETMLATAYDDYVGFRTDYADQYFVGGHNYSGTSYGGGRIWPYMFQIVEALNSSCGLDTWPGVTWADDVLQFYLYATLPGTKNGLWPDGNVGAGEMGFRNLEGITLPNMALNTTDIGQHVSWHIENVFDSNSSLLNAFYQVRSFMFLDPDWKKTDYRTIIPTGHAATGVGLYLARSNWTDSAATFWGLSAAEWLADHQGWDSGSFKIWRDGEWLIYENGPEGNGMSVNTNQMYLDDGYVLSAYSKLRYTGGFAYNNKTQDTFSEIERSISTTNYNYARGNITQSYADNRVLTSGSNPFYKLEHYSREIFHVKSSDYILVFDNVTSGAGMGSTNGIVNGNEVIKTMRIHVPGKPTVAGNTYSYTGANSKIIGNVVLPSSATITSTLLEDKTSAIRTDTPYRLDITRTSAPLAHDIFLTIYRTGNKSITMPTTAVISGIDIAGVYIAGSKPFAVLFANKKNGADLTEISIEVNLDSSGDIYFAGLTPATSYNVIAASGGNTTNHSLSTNSAGILELNLIDAGATNISIQKIEDNNSLDSINIPTPTIKKMTSKTVL